MPAYIDQFFEVLIEAGASDLHLAEGQPPKIRRHGDIVPLFPTTKWNT